MLGYFLHELKQKRGAIIGWGLGMSGFVLLYVGIYPSFIDEVINFEALLDLPIYQALGISNMSNFPGWISSTVLNFMPIILGVFALTAGVNTLASEEERGTLENIAALPIARWQIVTSKFLAILVALATVLLMTTLVTLAVTAWVDTQVELNVDYGAIFWALIAGFPLLALLSATALFFGAFLPRRNSASSAAIFLLIASYLSNNLFGQVEALRDFRFLSPFYYFNAAPEVITEGVIWSDIITLVALTLIFFVLALLSFHRRDLMVHRWIWDRPRLEH